MKASVVGFTLCLCLTPSLSFYRMTISSKSSSSSSPNCVVRALQAELRDAYSTNSDNRPDRPKKQAMQPAAANGPEQKVCQIAAAMAPSCSPLQDVPTQTFPIQHVRDLIFDLAASAGTLALLHRRRESSSRSSSSSTVSSPLPNETKQPDHVAAVMTDMLSTLVDLSVHLSINLQSACHKKIDLNAKKYPVELCKGKAGKYTEYSNVTGISKTAGQSIDDNGEKSPCSNDDVVDSLNAMSLFLQHSIPALTARTRQFAVDRDWERYHTPRNLVLALIGELGELAEIFQFKGDEEQQVLSVEEQDKIKQELADVTIYLVRLADMSGVSFLDQTTQ